MSKARWVRFGVSSVTVWLGMATVGWGQLAGPTTLPYAVLQDSSIGESGINALQLHQPPYSLTGRRIAIGQVEIGRPGLFGLDKAVSKNRAVSLVRVFFRNTFAKKNANVDPHAQNVASLMIGNAKAFQGVAPEAQLYASAIGILKRNGQPEECLSAQHIASQNGGDVRAINFSFGESLQEDPRPEAILDGNALLTQCVDWSARIHNVLYVIAGNQGKGGIPIPTDNFNGVNVAFTSRVEGQYAKVDFANLGEPIPGLAALKAGLESNVGPRRAIGLVAPGGQVLVMFPNGRIAKGSGTSFAAPHVTATVALLQEWGDRQLRDTFSKGHPKTLGRWTVDARQHEVMKAVLLNSADKLKDAGDGLRLGMTRTIVDKTNRTWLDTDAYNDPAIPLSFQMGTGQLNALRAYQQFSPGQWGPDLPVPPIGWDYHTVEDSPQATLQSTKASPILGFRDYVLEQPLRQDSYVAVTLAWDRRVELNDVNQNKAFDLGEIFRDRGLNNLDLYLMRAEDNDIAQSVAASTSTVDSVEHIFAPVPQTGHYKIRVVFRQKVNEATQPYGLAWWTAPAMVTGVPGGTVVPTLTSPANTLPEKGSIPEKTIAK